jgi:tight adherence protein C
VLLPIAVFGLFLAVMIGLSTVLVDVQERQRVRSSLKQLEGYDVRSERQRDLEGSIVDRVVAPLLATVNQAARRIWPAEYVAATRKKLLIAGITGEDATDRFLAIRIGGFCAVPAWWALTYLVLGLGGRNGLMIFGLLTLASVLGPQAWLDRKTGDRQKAIARQLPDILDLLTISVEAGLGFEQALDRIIGAVPGDLSDEFARMLGEVRAGSSRADAMRALDERTGVPELRSFVLAILQADTFGVSIGRILRQMADEMRVKRRQLAQERAQKAPIKMMVPMVFCVFPALFVVVIGPAVLSFMKSF